MELPLFPIPSVLYKGEENISDMGGVTAFLQVSGKTTLAAASFSRKVERSGSALSFVVP